MQQTDPGALIGAAALIVGFGITVIMFRIQRELWVQEQHPEWPNWLAWSDYLVVASVMLTLAFAIVPLLSFPVLTPCRRALASAACVAATILLAGYVPAILAHYRIEIGRSRTGVRLKGEPKERLVVFVSIAVASFGFIFTLWEHSRIR